MVLLCLAGVAAGQASRPAAEDPDKVRAAVNRLLQQGANALAAGDFAAGMDAFLDAQQLVDKAVKSRILAFGGPEHVALLHGLAINYQMVQKPEKASPLFDNNSVLDQACKKKDASRQLLITRGFLDATQGYLAMRTVVRLTDFLKERPEPDNEMLDVLLTALVKADERVANRELMLEPSIKLYEELSAKLEATRPKMKRWGVNWVTPKQFAEEKSRRDRSLKSYDSASQKYEEAIDHVKAAERRLDGARGSKDRGRINAASNALAAARGAQTDASRALAAAKAAIVPVPVLGKDDFRRILLGVGDKPSPDTAVASAPPPKPLSISGTQVAPTAAADPQVRPATSTKVEFEPPVAAPESRRTYSRSATGFAVAPELLLTAAAGVKDARRIIIEFPDSRQLEATVERTDDATGLALLRVKDKPMPYLNLADQFAGGDVVCPAYPDVSVFGVRLETLRGKTNAIKGDSFLVSLGRSPRLPGAPLLDANGGLIGVEMTQRDTLADRVPALGSNTIKTFLGSNLPTQRCMNAPQAPIVQITGIFEK